MTTPTHIFRPSLRCLHHASRQPLHILSKTRTFTSTASPQNEPSLSTAPTPLLLDPNLVSTRKEERLLQNTGIQPIGSRRRRAALQSSSPNIPFEQLPYQCFQEARKILASDRTEKLQRIEEERRRIAKAQAKDASECGGEAAKKGRLVAMHKFLEGLKINADINDPLIKKRFEDGEGDMSRPIYRYLADRQWRSYRRLLLLQRITQMSLVPDVLPHLSPTAEVTLAFGKRTVPPGDFVDSRVSEIPARLNVQVFDKGERMVTVAVVDPDVPDVVKDGFGYRCHFLAVNIPISPTSTALPLSRLSKDSQTVLPWLPPFAQKGSPYHRLGVFVLQQPEDKVLDFPKIKQKTKADGFKLTSFTARHMLRPIGVHMFRSQWDEGTAGVMGRAGVEGAEVEFQRKKPEKAPYQKKDGARYR